jgi:inosose dehydratase
MPTADIAISLDMVNRHYQEPNRNRYESKYYWEELYELITAAGFRSIEIPYEPVWQFGGRSGVPFTRYCVDAKYGDSASYRGFLAQHGIDNVVGVCFEPSLFMRNRNLDFYFGATNHFAREALSHAVDLGASYFNISPTPAHGRIKHHHPELDESAFIARTIELLASLAEQADKDGIRLAIRHEYWSLLRGERIVEVLEELPDSASIDVDVASLQIGGVDPVAFVKKYFDRVGSVHLTDTAFVDDDETWKTPNPEFPAKRPTQVYRDLGEGDVDLKAVYGTLRDLGYRGPITCSCRQTRDHMRALLRTRAHLDSHILVSN